MQRPPIDVLHWTLGLLPFLLVLLVGRNGRPEGAGPVGMFIAAIIAVVVP